MKNSGLSLFVTSFKPGLYISAARYHKLFAAPACLSAKSALSCLKQTKKKQRKLFYYSMHASCTER